MKCDRSEPILESKDMHATFQRMGKKGKKKKAKYSKLWKYLEKGQVIACDYCTHWTVRIGPADITVTATAVQWYSEKHLFCKCQKKDTRVNWIKIKSLENNCVGVHF